MSEWLLYFFAAAVVSNVVLSTGFGTSLSLRISRHPRDILWFGGFLTLFSVLTVCSSALLDTVLPFHAEFHHVRPLIVIGVVTVWYLLTVLLLKKVSPTHYGRFELWLSMAAYNNVVVGGALIANHQFSVGFWGALGMSIGGGVGFTLLTLLIAEAREQLDHSDMPRAFRGLPGMLLWMGLIALALMGFSSTVSFI